MGRVPFEMAPPGTDPTQQRNRVMMQSGWRQALPWIAITVAFVFLGYVLLGGKMPQVGKREPTPAPTAAQSASEPPTAAPTATETAIPTVTRSESLSESETVTPTVERPPTASITAEGASLVTFDVGGVSCWCYKDGRPPGGDDPELCQEHEPEVCDG